LTDGVKTTIFLFFFAFPALGFYNIQPIIIL